MTYKNPEDQAEYLRKWRNDNRERTNYLAKVNRDKLRKRNKEYVWDIKKNSPCVDCGGFFHPVCMDFDHVGTDKVGEVSRLARTSSIKRIQTEIDKCELVCSNCHRLRTHNRSAPNQI